MTIQKQALPEKIEWPNYPYYKVAGVHLKQPKDWALPEDPEPIAEDYDFKTITQPRHSNHRS
jgi:hypothetical protein